MYVRWQDAAKHSMCTEVHFHHRLDVLGALDPQEQNALSLRHLQDKALSENT